MWEPDKDVNLILNKLSDIKGELVSIDNRLHKIELLDAVQNQQLKEHMRRTEAAEKKLEKLENFKWYFGGLAVLLAACSEVLVRLLP